MTHQWDIVSAERLLNDDIFISWFNLKKMRKNINQFMVKKLEKKLFQIRFNFRKRMRNLKLVKRGKMNPTVGILPDGFVVVW